MMNLDGAMSILAILILPSSWNLWMREAATPTTLPDNPPVLREIIGTQAQEIERLRRENDLLKHYIRELRKQHYGPRSERLPESQKIFEFYGRVEEAKEKEKPAPPEGQAASTPAEWKKPTGRKVIPPELERKVVVHDIPDHDKNCAECKEALAKIGEEVSERLEYQKAQLYVIQDVRPKYACAKGCATGVAVADPPAQVIPKAKVGPSLLAHVLWAKYGLHLPLHRQEIMFGMIGLEIPRSTLCLWVGRCVELLFPIYEAMKRDILLSEVLFSDDSPVRLLEPGLGKTRQARVWSYCGDLFHRQIVYEFTQSREQTWPQAFLKDWKGVLQVDAYPGYTSLLELDRIIAAYCWAHARRKYIEAQETDKERSRIALAFIQKLYAVEREIKGIAPKRKKRVRRSRATKILNRFKTWLDQEIQKVLPKSPIGQAIQYTRGHWEGLLTYTKNGAVEIDSNRVERSIRGIKVGLHNWLFFGSEDGGKWGAVLYSLIETCKLHRINPEAYLKDVLVRISTTPQSQIHTLMPRLWQPLPPNTS
jgi:transposase